MANDDIQGTVTDSNGNQISGAVVEVTRAQDDGSPAEQTVVRTTTDANGNFLIDSHPDGDGTSQDWHVTGYNWTGSSWQQSLNKPGVTASLGSATPDSVIYDYENGDAAGWTNNNGDPLTAVQTTQNGGSPPDGSYAGEANINGANSNNAYSISALSPTDLIVYCRIENASSADGHSVNYAHRSGGSSVLQVLLDPANTNVQINSSDSGVSFQQDHWFEVIYRDINWSTDTVGSVEIDGTEAMTGVGFINTASSIDEILTFAGESGGEFWAYNDYWAYNP